MKKKVKKYVGTTSREKHKNIQNRKRWILVWVILTLIILTIYYGIGLGFSIGGLATNSIIYASSVYIFPLFFAGGFLGSNVPGISIVYGKLFRISIFFILGFMTVYVVWMVIVIITLPAWSIENWIIVIIVIVLDTLIYIGAIACLSWINSVIKEYKKNYKGEKSLELQECYQITSFFRFTNYHTTNQWIFIVFNWFFFVVFCICLIFGSLHFSSGQPTHFSIWITLGFTLWGILYLQFYLETLSKEEEGKGNGDFESDLKNRRGVRAMSSLISFGVFTIGFVIVLVYYIIMLSVFHTVVCCSTPGLSWTIWFVMIANCIQALLCVIIISISIYNMYHYNFLKNFSENWDERGEFLTQKIGREGGRSGNKVAIASSTHSKKRRSKYFV